MTPTLCTPAPGRIIQGSRPHVSAIKPTQKCVADRAFYGWPSGACAPTGGDCAIARD